MEQRIRYMAVNEYQYLSVQNIPTEKGMMRVFFETRSMTFKIISDTTNEVVAEGKATSPHKIKIKVKNALMKLGAPLGKVESRAKCLNRKNKSKKYQVKNA